MAIISRAERQNKHDQKSVVEGPAGPWHVRTPRRIRTAYQSATDQQSWSLWRKNVARGKARSIGELLGGKRSALTWAPPDDVDLEQTFELIEQLHPLHRSGRPQADALENDAACWLSNIESAKPSVALGLECLAWCGALRSLTAHLPAQLWWLLVNRLISLAQEEPSSSVDPLASQLLWGELPLALAYALPELEVSRGLADAGRNSISQAIEELLDGEGLPHGRHLRWMRPLLACWTRSQAIGREFKQGWCNKAAGRQYPGLVEHALRLSRANGQVVLGRPESRPWQSSLLKSAVAFADDRDVDRVFRLMRKPGPAAAKTSAKSRPAVGFQGEWAGIAELRTAWSPKSQRLTVLYDTPAVETELSVNGDCLWKGAWHFDVRVNDTPLKAQGNWIQTCWISNGDVDYLELEIDLSDEVSIQRHILLAHEDRFLLLADAVLGIQESTIEYRGTLDLTYGVSFRGESETREGSLMIGTQPRARVLPLALNEWRSASVRGTLHAGQSGLELLQTGQGGSLFAPMFFDLDPRRQERELTWRQLTVGQSREIVPVDVAAGYRVQIGKSNWLIYRSLATPDVRTVLGKNLMTEFLVGRFSTSDGSVEDLLEIE